VGDDHALEHGESIGMMRWASGFLEEGDKRKKQRAWVGGSTVVDGSEGSNGKGIRGKRRGEDKEKKRGNPHGAGKGRGFSPCLDKGKIGSDPISRGPLGLMQNPARSQPHINKEEEMKLTKKQRTKEG